MRLVIETGPKGDHDPEVIEVAKDDVVRILVHEDNRSLHISVTSRGGPVRAIRFDGDDWTAFTIDQEEDEI